MAHFYFLKYLHSAFQVIYIHARFNSPLLYQYLVLTKYISVIKDHEKAPGQTQDFTEFPPVTTPTHNYIFIYVI